MEPGLRRVLADNPSPMTWRGTNTYIVGEGQVAVIDPGPALPGHLEAILSALHPAETVSHIVVTHSHLDHSPLARPLAARTGAPVLAFGDSSAGRRADLATLAGLGGGEGVENGFAPDAAFTDGQEISGDGWALRALHTPGHMGNHLCLAWDDRIFTGDHVMGWASSMVSPPDGDLGAFMTSLERLQGLGPSRLFPGHGAPVTDGLARIRELAGHRRTREAQILAILKERCATAAEITACVYTETPGPLLPAAARNVLAHLIDLTDKKYAEPLGPLAFSTRFRGTEK
nr:MBL fold metallo-hydrolase [Rhodovulum imhoffii]